MDIKKLRRWLNVKKLIICVTLLMLAISLLSGCGQKYVYSIQMIDPEPNGNKLVFEDNGLLMKFEPSIYASKGSLASDLKGINIEMENNTGKTVKILWDDISFINVDKTVSKIIHNGVRFINKGESMSSTSIPTGAKFDDTIVPIDNISWNDFSDNWVNVGIVNQNNASTCDQKDIGILLPLKIGDERKEYQFKFRITVGQAI